MTFVLIVVLLGGYGWNTPATSSTEFTSKERCEAAGARLEAAVRSVDSKVTVQAICVEK
jgi:hypothetical protein